MSVPGRLVLGALPDPVLRTLADFERSFGATVRLTVPAGESGAADEVLPPAEIGRRIAQLAPVRSP